ncbi:DDE Tnp4 domain-containing protein [Caerostris extrusa]|uniref:DDE Tnp4 domain-containing protein n=1 Tax=Caerostris extrusa TaxID=172846 RepID=A0AAV4QXL9_CAEEX|nr:DDE Tnp4 domain-containing protein [Caerostris extrusa]
MPDSWQCALLVSILALKQKKRRCWAPPNTGRQYHNYKGGFSIILLASVDADYKFVLVDIGSEGHNSDGGVFRHSVISQAIECNQMNIPNSAALTSTKTVIPFVFVGDEAFPLKNYLMRPFPGNALSKERRIFNYRLSRARRCVENAFGSSQVSNISETYYCQCGNMQGNCCSYCMLE